MLLFWKILLTEFIAEMGDKTQLMLIALTSKYKIRDILIGTAAAIMVLNGIAVLAGGFVSEFVPTWLIRLIAACAFMYFALSTLAGEDEEEEETGEGKAGLLSRFAALAVFSTFFVAELGDKTQLTAITFGANEGLSSGLIVWSACCIGLFAADILGMMAGYLLKSKMPEGFLNGIAFLVFSVFGIVTLRQGLIMLLGENDSRVMVILLVAAAIFVVACGGILLRKRKLKTI